MQLVIEAADLHLELRDPFTLSYGTSTSRDNVLVRVAADDVEGLGEAPCPPYYGVGAAEIIAEVCAPRVAAALSEAEGSLESWLETLDDLSIAPRPARAALDIALHDLWGKLQGRPLHALWGIDPAACPASSLTVAMDDDSARYRRRLQAASSFKLVKLKLGCGDPERDLACLEVAGEVLGGSRLAVDANGAWSAAETLKLLPAMVRWEPLYLEQPVSRHDFEGWRELRAGWPSIRRPGTASPLLIADESVQGAADLTPLAGLADGVNIKLSKCGGLSSGRAMVRKAHELGLQVMIGCMIESSVGVSAAALLGPSARFTDLDGSALISNDPFCGVELLATGKVRYTNDPGLGVTRRPG